MRFEWPTRTMCRVCCHGLPVSEPSPLAADQYYMLYCNTHRVHVYSSVHMYVHVYARLVLEYVRVLGFHGVVHDSGFKHNILNIYGHIANPRAIPWQGTGTGTGIAQHHTYIPVHVYTCTVRTCTRVSILVRTPVLGVPGYSAVEKKQIDAPVDLWVRARLSFGAPGWPKS